MVYNHSNALTSSDRRQSLYDEIEGGGGDAGCPSRGGRMAAEGGLGCSSCAAQHCLFR
jgi:hypothetical protein